MAEIENRTFVDSEFYYMEKETKPPKGYFTQLNDTFVEQENLLKYALEQTQKDPYYRDSFMDKVLDYIESDKKATEKFLKWFYPDYKEEKENN